MELKDFPLPKVSEKCPQCGKAGQVKEAYDALRAEGKIPEEALKENSFVLEAKLVDVEHLPFTLTNSIKVPVMRFYFERCECGNVWSPKFDIREEDIPIQFQSIPKTPPPGKGRLHGGNGGGGGIFH